MIWRLHFLSAVSYGYMHRSHTTPFKNPSVCPSLHPPETEVPNSSSEVGTASFKIAALCQLYR